MDLELSDEQSWLSDAVELLLAREWNPAPEDPLGEQDARTALWASLVEFGGLSVGHEDGLGAIELCLIARHLGAHLAPLPYIGSAALRFAIAPLQAELPAGLRELATGTDAVAAALLEPGCGWDLREPRTTIDSLVLNGRKAGVEHLGAVRRLA